MNTAFFPRRLILRIPAFHIEPRAEFLEPLRPQCAKASRTDLLNQTEEADVSECFL